MEKVLFNPKPKDRYIAVPSKSVAIRALILAAFCDYETEIVIPSYGQDVNQTYECLKKLGVKIQKTAAGFKITPGIKVREGDRITLECKESATLYRFFTEIIRRLKLEDQVKLAGSKRLIERINSEAKTSQNLSAKLIANAVTKKKELIKIPDDQVSRGYINLTKSVIELFYGEKKTERYVVEGDYGLAANFIVLAALQDEEITIENLNENSAQPDKEILNIVEKFGASIRWEDGNLIVRGEKKKPGRVEIDGSIAPDLVPITAVLASFSKKTTFIGNIDYLRYKESDRIKSTKDMINRLGGDADERRGGLVIKPRRLNGGRVESNNDHRIAMATAIASCFTDGMVKIEGFDAVRKSYPDFFKDFLE